MTDGAIAAHDGGIVTACSVVAGGTDLQRAASLLRARPALEAGVHLVLAGGPLVSSPADVPTLAPGGRPLADHRAFLARLALRRIDLREVERELRRQIERVRGMGLRITHLNGHQHLHVAPGVPRLVAALAREYGIGYVRVPQEDARPRDPRTLSIWVLARLASRAKQMLGDAGIATNDRAGGIVDAGQLTVPRLRAAVSRATGVTELVTHPGTGNERIAALWRWGYDWDGERDALCDASLREELARAQVRLIRPSEVAWPS